MRYSVIIPAAGSGTRFGGEIPKQFLLLGGTPVLAHAIDRFFRDANVDRIVVAVSPEQLDTIQAMIERYRWGNVRAVRGGETRQESVSNALGSPSVAGAEIIAVHDSVRPFVDIARVHEAVAIAAEHGAAILALPAHETLHRVVDSKIAETLDRSAIWAAQTPQCFRANILRESLEKARRDGYTATDEAAAVIRAGHVVRVVEGSSDNIKITRREDLAIAEMILSSRKEMQ